jgi:hypothetical protein
MGQEAERRNNFRGSPLAFSRHSRLRGVNRRPERLMWKLSIDIADWKAPAFRRVLASAELLSDRAIDTGSSRVNTPASRSRALLLLPTLAIHPCPESLCGSFCFIQQYSAKPLSHATREKPAFAQRREHARNHWMTFLFLSLLAMAMPHPVAAADVSLTDAQAIEIGRRIWKNECAGTVSGLTAWNMGEEFPSLGIAHFIWYPAGHRGPFEESWPRLARFLKDHKQPVEDWMLGPCPWNVRTEFQADMQGSRLQKLRALLSSTVALQARFAAMRLEQALPRMLAKSQKNNRALVEANFRRVAKCPLGFYALVDYVNFKGEGVNPAERYRGEGWGLLQVLEIMPAEDEPMSGFAKAADHILTRRVANSPTARSESRWLPGWRNRINTYLQ